jgi:membrane fusion protein (multidrug efflux system)
MSAPTLQEDVALSDKKPAPAPAFAPATIATPGKKLQSLFERNKRPLLIAAGVIALIAIAFYSYDSFTHEETDDAYVTGHLHNVATRINAVVTDVLVDDNQFVHEGDTLVKLDPSEYIALVAAAQAQLAKAQADLDRQTPLVAMHAVSPEDLDATKSTRDVDLAQLKLAQLQIDYSTIKAPASGYVGRKSVETGNRVSSGQTLMVIVEPELWVVANFKETQLARMKTGQPATITVDSIPGKVFTGRVDSFSPATGNEFALLPADNSTGNFTKIVQRVPVKVVFDPESVKGYEDRVRAGESAVVKVALTDPPQP